MDPTAAAWRDLATLGNYRQHLTTSTLTGVSFAVGAYALAGLHWLYGSVAALLATISGLLPDLDHPIGVELKGVTGTLGVLTAVAVWHHLDHATPNLPFEAHLWAVVASYLFVKYGLRQVLARIMVHRGISHSLPTCAVWGALTFLYYPSDFTALRTWMAMAVMLGSLSHLVLDEVFSVDLAGERIKRSFGSALKFWAPSASSTLAIYALLFLLVRSVIDLWPDATPAEVLAAPVPSPSLPEWPRGSPPGSLRSLQIRPPGPGWLE